MHGLIVLSVVGATVFGVPALLFAWARWLNGRAIAPRVVRRTAFALIAIAALKWLGVLAALGPYFLHERIDIDDWHRQRIAAERLSSTMSYVEMSFVLELVATIWLLFATSNYHWLARPPTVPRDPPYR